VQLTDVPLLVQLAGSPAAVLMLRNGTTDIRTNNAPSNATERVLFMAPVVGR
jgi:hypothetical protein